MEIWNSTQNLQIEKMAANTGAGKRQAIKWIRDRAKSAYVKMPTCYICDSSEALELHHTHSLTNLFEKWVKDKGLNIETDEDVLEIRDDFINQHHGEIYTDVFTLCLKHHQMLHGIYGKAPELHTAKKQSVWINKQKDKFNGIINEEHKRLDSRETQSGSGTNLKRSWLEYRIKPNPNILAGMGTI